MTLVDELALEGREHLAPSYVAGYARKAGVDPEESLAVLRRHGFASDSTLVDLGAGTGSFAVAAAIECRHVVAVDISPPWWTRSARRSQPAGSRTWTSSRPDS